jgi:hypothetical protein
MSDSGDQAKESFIRGLEAKAGKPLEELLAIVATWGPGKHGELLAKAKETLGLGHGHANLLIHEFRARSEAASARPRPPTRSTRSTPAPRRRCGRCTRR